MAKQQFRLAIGSPSKRQSGIWRIWSNWKGDIYVANRCLGGIYKASFHKDRKCQFGFTEEYANKAYERFGRNERHIEKWMLPEAAIVRAVQILIPESELRDSLKTEDKEITWLETPPSGSIGTISLFITDKDFELNISSNVPGAKIIGRLNTKIRWAWITYAFTTPDDKLATVIEFGRRRLISIIANTSYPPGTRASLWDSKNSYDRHVLELACDIAG